MHQMTFAGGLMADDDTTAKIGAITAQLPKLGVEQLSFIQSVVDRLSQPFTFNRNEQSDLVTAPVLRDFGDLLRVHHVMSAESLSKDRFEYALEKVLNDCGIPAKRSSRGNPGHDLTIRDVPFSLKTEASKNIKETAVHISKFMEMGKGQWTDQLEDLDGLRDRFFNHMKSYERILTLRRLPRDGHHFYELVEIPKALLLEAEHGEMEMMFGSRQMPKPGYCTVTDEFGRVKFQLYFDGGTERKLQIKALDKGLCIVHATWSFPMATVPEL